MVLELDTKARRDLMLLAHSGYVGRTEANFILWNVLTKEALDVPYTNLSSLVSNRVHAARQQFDRPPNWNADFKYWGWDKYLHPRPLVAPFAPGAVPEAGTFEIQTGDGEVPLAPPMCWRPLDRGHGRRAEPRQRGGAAVQDIAEQDKHEGPFVYNRLGPAALREILAGLREYLKDLKAH